MTVIQQNDVPVETVDGGKKLITPHRSPQPSEVLEEHSAIPEKQVNDNFQFFRIFLGIITKIKLFSICKLNYPENESIGINIYYLEFHVNSQ